jgi:hypothetical protein
MIIVRLLSTRAFLVGLAPPKFTQVSEPALLWNQYHKQPSSWQMMDNSDIISILGE